MNQRTTWVHQSAFETAKALQNRSLSAYEHTLSCLEQIERLEPDVHAFAHLNKEGALAHARTLDTLAIQGGLHGLTVGIKDVFETWDMPTQGGSEVFKNNQAHQDAACIASLRAAGAVMLGKTITTELATFPTNGTRNPLNLAHTPGGSSSGSAAAVAAKMVSFATGTQTMGSTIRPCGYCGVTGFKPSYNLIPKRGVWPNADSVDTVGLVARDVRDVAFFAAEMVGYPALRIEQERDQDLAKPTIGMCRSHEWERADEHIHAAFENSKKIFIDQGARVIDIALPHDFQGLLEAHRTIVNFEMSRGFMDILKRHASLMRPELLARTLEGLKVTPEDYQAAQRLARQCRQGLDAVMGECHVLFTPAATGEAPKGQAYSGDTTMNQVWTLMHGPCISVTGGHGPHGLPLAMQVVGRIDDDAKTLKAGHWIDTVLKRQLTS